MKCERDERKLNSPSHFTQVEVKLKELGANFELYRFVLHSWVHVEEQSKCGKSFCVGEKFVCTSERFACEVVQAALEELRHSR